MKGAKSRDDASELEPQVEQEGVPASFADEVTLGQLSGDEQLVLDILAGYPTGATLGRLRGRCTLPEEQLVGCLDGLRRKGLVVRLNTVVESYSCRFPGVRVS